MPSEKLFIVCYDVSRNRARASVAKYLEGVGCRVQGSVFEVWMTTARAKKLVQRLSAFIDRGDSLRIYPLTERGIDGSIVLGRGTSPERSDYYLL